MNYHEIVSNKPPPIWSIWPKHRHLDEVKYDDCVVTYHYESTGKRFAIWEHLYIYELECVLVDVEEKDEI
jgi:hypothetical protein